MTVMFIVLFSFIYFCGIFIHFNVACLYDSGDIFPLVPFILLDLFFKSVFLWYFHRFFFLSVQRICIIFTFSHVADAFIECDVHMRRIEANKTNKRARTCKRITSLNELNTVH